LISVRNIGSPHSFGWNVRHSACAAAGAYSAGLITEEQRQDILHNACPGAGACGGMYTANTVRVFTDFKKSES